VKEIDDVGLSQVTAHCLENIAQNCSCCGGCCSSCSCCGCWSGRPGAGGVQWRCVRPTETTLARFRNVTIFEEPALVIVVREELAGWRISSTSALALAGAA